MNYTELKKLMTDFRLGIITKNEMKCAIALWQLKNFGGIA